MYFYHAHAIAFGGRIDSKPLNIQQGSCALAVTGGESNAVATTPDPKFSDITFKSANSKVSGVANKNGGLDTYVTTAHVDLEGLNIRGKVKIDKIVADVQSTYTSRNYEAIITVSGSIDGLTINDKVVKVGVSTDFMTQYTTYGSMQVAFQNRYSNQFVNCIMGYGLTDKLATTSDLKAAYEAFDEQSTLSTLKSAVICSLVKDVGNLPEGATGCGGPSIIKIDGFGTLYLGELIVWPWMRCLNMFRIELVAADNKPPGSISGGSVGANGTGYPPGYSPPGNGW